MRPPNLLIVMLCVSACSDSSLQAKPVGITDSQCAAVRALGSRTLSIVVQKGEAAPIVPVIDGIAAARAVDTFEAALNQRWSYRHANRADFQTAIASLRKRIASGIAIDELGVELQKIVALGIDGHAGVSGYRRPSNRYLPFLIEATGERYVGFNSKRTAFLADGFPFVTKIDGKNITEWLAAVAVLVPKGSLQYVRHNSLRVLREIDYWRAGMGLPQKDTIEIELVDKRGKAGKVITLPLVKSPLTYGAWPSHGSRLLDGEIGYLRLASMQRDTSVAEIKQWLPKFRDTAGLIVDVRDNNGGDRDALILLYSYFANPDDPPRVFTAAAYRLHSAHPQNHLAENHRMYRVDAEEWTSSQREAVARFAKSFKPQWMLPGNQFSEWHYMALKRLDDQAIYHYNKPVIVL